MDFTYKERTVEGTQRSIKVAETVCFEDAAEVEFAIACIDTMRLFLELGDHNTGIDDDALVGLSRLYANASERLRQLVGTGTEISQALLPAGLTFDSATYNCADYQVADPVQRCVQTVTTNLEVQHFFPEDRTDLLTLFLQDTDPSL